MAAKLEIHETRNPRGTRPGVTTKGDIGMPTTQDTTVRTVAAHWKSRIPKDAASFQNQTANG